MIFQLIMSPSFRKQTLHPPSKEEGVGNLQLVRDIFEICIRYWTWKGPIYSSGLA